MKFPVFSLLAGNFGLPETSSLLTASSSGESVANLIWERQLRAAPPKIVETFRPGQRASLLAAATTSASSAVSRFDARVPLSISSRSARAFAPASDRAAVRAAARSEFRRDHVGVDFAQQL